MQRFLHQKRFASNILNGTIKSIIIQGYCGLRHSQYISGNADTILKNRHDVLIQAYQRNPVRFKNQTPELKKLPNAVYINPPQVIEINSRQHEEVLAG